MAARIEPHASNANYSSIAWGPCYITMVVGVARNKHRTSAEEIFLSSSIRFEIVLFCLKLLKMEK